MLDRKLVRDLGRLRGQAITIALVIASGIAQAIAFVIFYQSLEASRDAFYAQSRFADLFVHLERAPRSLLPRLAEIPGVARVEGRVSGDFRLDFEGITDPVTARFLSVDADRSAPLNALLIVEGRAIDPGSTREVVVSRGFAEARHLHPGDSLIAVLNGREVRLQIVGVGLSPEYVWAPNPRTNFPDPEHFGVLWMDRRALEDVLGLSGAFNDVVVALSSDAQPEDVISALDRQLEPYGGRAIVERANQPSNFVLDMKIAQWRSTAKTVPVIFLLVAAFLLNLVLSRVVGTQREQIATLKALGYSTFAIGRHYLLLALAVCTLGCLLGVGLGVLEGEAGVRILGKYFNLPAFVYRVDLSVVAVAVVVGMGAGLLGVFSSVRKAVILPAAEAMQPERPESFRRTFIERFGLDRLFGVAGRMVLRDVERHPIRLALSALAVAFATSMLLIGATMMDSMNRALFIQFRKVQGEDVTVAFDSPHGTGAIRSLQHLPGVHYSEVQRLVPVRMHAGLRHRDVVLVGVLPDASLRPLRDNQGDIVRLTPDGVTLSRPLGSILHVGLGDTVEMDVLESGQKSLSLPVSGFVDDFSGLSAYVDLSRLQRALDEPPTASGALLSIDRSALHDVTQRLEKLPAVASFSRPDLDERQFVDQEADAFKSMYVILILVASVIAVGVVFNNARIALAVRSRDLATLRILGFTRGEVATVLLGEQAIQLVVGVLAGIPLGYGFGVAVLRLLPAELFRITPSLTILSAVGSAVVVLVAGLGSAFLVRREADRLDLVAVLKAHD
jgi:putative ABC transport system permease protein